MCRLDLNKFLVSPDKRIFSINGYSIDIIVAQNLWQRFIGLLCRRSLPSDCGMLLTHCNRIHTFGMLFPIDILFLDAEYKIVSIETNVKSCRILKCRNAQHVLELAAGTAYSLGVCPSN